MRMEQTFTNNLSHEGPFVTSSYHNTLGKKKIVLFLAMSHPILTSINTARRWFSGIEIMMLYPM